MEDTGDQDDLFSNVTRLRRGAGSAERDAAKHAKVTVGTWREKVFRHIAGGAETTAEVYDGLADMHPCLDCGCTHRSPKPVNEIGTRFGDLRDMALIHRIMDYETGDWLTKTIRGQKYERHSLTNRGRQLAMQLYGGTS